VCNSPLGHKVNSLTRYFLHILLDPVRYVLVAGRGGSSTTGTRRPDASGAAASPQFSRARAVLSPELLRPDPRASRSSRRASLPPLAGSRCHGSGGRCRNTSDAPARVGLGQMTVVRAGVPETAVDVHRDPRPRSRMSTRRRRLPPGTGGSTTNLEPRLCRARRNASSAACRTLWSGASPVKLRATKRVEVPVRGTSVPGSTDATWE
jgi:hypothetical protein